MKIFKNFFQNFIQNRWRLNTPTSPMGMGWRYLQGVVVVYMGMYKYIFL